MSWINSVMARSFGRKPKAATNPQPNLVFAAPPAPREGVPVHGFLHVLHVQNVPLIVAVSVALGVGAYKVSEKVSERLARGQEGRRREVVQ